MKEIRGDLIELAKKGKFDVILHGCNCFQTMGSGIAAQIKKEFPEAYNADLKTTHGDRDKLGTVSSCNVERDGVKFHVVNCYTQFAYGTHQRQVDYDAVRRCMLEVKRLFPGKRIGYPMIGAGLAGGDWDAICDIIDTCLSGMDHTLVIYRK